MPSQTTFNLIAYARAIGSKMLATSEVRFRNDIQPQAIVADFSNLTPAHEPPLAIFGGSIPAVALESAAYRVQSLGPGGCFVLQATHQTALFGLAFLAIDSGIPFNNLVTHPANVASNEAPRSIVTSGTVLAAAQPAAATTPVVTAAVVPQGIWLPPGSELAIFVQQINLVVPFLIVVADVPASEGGD